MQISSLPFLIIVIFSFLLFLVRMLHKQDHLSVSERNSLYTLLFTLFALGANSAYLSNKGIYVSDDFLQLMPGYWLPYISVIISITLVLLITPLRSGLRNFVDYAPNYLLSGIHILRILAIGSILKATMGIFPENFAWYVGIPDLLFGLSAIYITLLARKNRLNDDQLMIWHITGILVIVLPASTLMHIFMKDDLFQELFTFPMSLAPTVVVPMLVLLNMMVVWRLLERKILTKSMRASL